VKRDALALTWAMAFPSVMTWIYFVLAAGGGADSSHLVVIAYTAGKVIQFVFPVIYVGLTEPRSLRPSWPGWRGLRFGLLFGLIVGGAALALYFFVLKDTKYLRDAPDKIFAKLHESGYDTLGGYIAVACFLSIFHSLLEEYYWRWFVFGWLKRYLRVWIALVLASLGFMAHHVIVLAVFFPGVQKFFTAVVPLSLGIAIGGGVWCWIYQRTGSLYASWVSHMLIDAAVMVIGYDMVAGRLGR